LKQEPVPGGWLSTGDMARIHPDGSLDIVDRSKDVIKSGGEWISSVVIENAALGHAGVAQAAVIAIPHPRGKTAAVDRRAQARQRCTA